MAEQRPNSDVFGLCFYNKIKLYLIEGDFLTELFREFKFGFSYSLAGTIHERVYENNDEEYLTDHFNPNVKSFQERIIKPNKNTLLHDFIGYYWEDELSYIRSKLDFETISEYYEKI